jgi:hypothetical protein
MYLLILYLIRRDEELARRLAAEFGQSSDHDDASIEAKQMSEEQLLRARKDQELRYVSLLGTIYAQVKDAHCI